MTPIRNAQSVGRNAPHLVLFDVDGTLLVTGGATSRCIRRACERVLGERFRWTKVTPGRLDPQLFADLAAGCGIERASEKLDEYKAAYLSELQAELACRRDDVKVLPGVHELLKELQVRDDVVIGLLTGNFRRAVELKLEAAGLERGQFPIGAFAEDGNERCDLVTAALRQFEQLTGAALPADRVILVGDTPQDIACARRAGCRVLSVSTGHYSLDDLKREKPDAAVATLEDVEPLRAMLEGNSATDEHR